MNKKSGFVTFILSFIPGLSHLYLGFKDRAFIFLITFFGSIFSILGVSLVLNWEEFLVFLFVEPLIWLIALIDAFSLRKEAELYSNGNDNNIENEMTMKHVDDIKKTNKKTIAMVLSIIPGAGHMYLGYQNKGLTIMTVFFFAVFLMGWLNVSLFLFILPVIWFYSFFDAFHSFDKEKDNDKKFTFIFSNIKPRWIGWAFIIIGILVVVERVIYTFISYRIRNYIQSIVVAVIFIAGGIRLLMKNKAQESKGDEGKCEKEE